MCGITLKAVGNASPPSAICAMGESLIFIGSWLGHSNVVSYRFEDPEVIAKAEKPLAASGSIVDAVEQTPTVPHIAGGSITKEEEPIDSDTGLLATMDSTAAVDAAAAAVVGSPVASEASPTSAMSTELLAPGSSGLDALVEQMKAEPSATVTDLPAAEAVAVAPDDGEEKIQMETETPQADAPAERPKRSFGSIEGPSGQDSQSDEGSPAAKLPRIDEALTGIVLAIEAASPKSTSPTQSSPAAGLPFGPRGGTLVPGLGRGVVPGLGMIGTPAVTREESSTLTRGPEAPLEEENPSASSDDDNLEASLYQCAAIHIPFLHTPVHDLAFLAWCSAIDLIADRVHVQS